MRIHPPGFETPRPPGARLEPGNRFFTHLSFFYAKMGSKSKKRASSAPRYFQCASFGFFVYPIRIAQGPISGLEKRSKMKGGPRCTFNIWKRCVLTRAFRICLPFSKKRNRLADTAVLIFQKFAKNPKKKKFA